MVVRQLVDTRFPSPGAGEIKAAWTARLVLTLLLLGTPAGLVAELSSSGSQLIGAVELGFNPEDGQELGSALASGDFDGDGFDDLAIGAHFAYDNTGIVVVVYGGEGGLDLDRTLFLAPVPMLNCPVATEFFFFGWSLVTGNFNGDLYDDLAVGAPGADTTSFTSTCAPGTGNVQVFEGSSTGIDAGSRSFVYDPAGSPGDELGFSLAAGRMNEDSYEDLAAGVPGARHPPNDSAGGVMIWFGSSGGPSLGSRLRVGQGANPNARSGVALAAGDIYGDGLDEVLVGVPGFSEVILGTEFIGALRILDSSDDFLPALTLIQDEDVGLGLTVASGNVDADGFDDLVYSTPFRSIDPLSPDEEGMVEVESGGEGPFLSCGAINLTQGSGAEPFDHFGEALATGDFDGDGWDDVVVGTPGENLDDGTPGVKLDAGAVDILFFRPWLNCFVLDRRQRWHLDLPGTPGVAEGNDKFGRALAVGDFDGDQRDDLAIGVPMEDGAEPDQGAVLVLLNTGLFSDDFETGDLERWSASVP